MIAKVQSIYRYPVKGLSPEPLPRAKLAVGQTVAGDRLYAIENGPLRLRPGGAALCAQDALSDADAR